MRKRSLLYRATKNKKEEQQNSQVNQLLLQNEASGKGVKILNASGNFNVQLESLPEDEEYWNTFTSLETLDLSGNLLQSLPVGMGDLPNPKTNVKLKGNPLQSLPDNLIAEYCWPDIKKHLQEVKKESQVPERKLVFVGEAGVGKSILIFFFLNVNSVVDILSFTATLVKLLAGSDIRGTNPTIGMEVSNFQFPNGKYRYTAWDFGE